MGPRNIGPRGPPRSQARRHRPIAVPGRGSPRRRSGRREFFTTVWTTSRSPRSTRTSVIASVSEVRSAIAARCCWLLLAAFASNSRSPMPFRLAKHRRRDLNVVVKREHVDDFGGSIANRRQTVRQLGARLGLDGLHQADHDVIEHADLIFGKTRRSDDEQIGDAREHLDPACVGAGRERSLEFIEQRKGTHHATRRRTPLN